MGKRKWREVRLGEICMTNLKTYSIKENWDFINYLDTGNITKNKISEIQLLNCKTDKIPSRAKRIVEIGDIIYSTVRPNQQHYGIIKDKVENLLVSTGFTTITINADIADNRFIYFFLIQQKITDQLQTLAEQSTSTYPSIKPMDIEDIEISLPPLPTQQKIASILSALDDKIELNQKINDNLEQQAQALFKSWFVDFEPFQDGEFIESELGMIPKGWRVGQLDEIGSIVGGGTPSKLEQEYFTTNGIPWITPRDLSINNVKFTAKGEIDITEIGYNNSSAKILPQGTVLFSSRAPIGYISIAKNNISTNQGFKSVIPKIAGTAFIYYFLKTNTPKIELQATGSTFKEASGSLIKSLKTPIPNIEIFDNFEHLLTSFFTIQEKNEMENEKLTQLRDTLLPKLMSGELSVEEIEI